MANRTVKENLKIADKRLAEAQARLATPEPDMQDVKRDIFNARQRIREMWEELGL